MYKDIKNHFDNNITFVFKFKGDVYALNGCTLYNHSRDDIKEYVYEMYDVDLCYGIDIDMIAGDITEDITREEMFFIMSDAEFNIFNQYHYDTSDVDLTYGIVDIKEWYLSDIHTVIKHIKQGNTHFTRSIFNHKGLIDLTVDELKADVINNIIHNGFNNGFKMDDFGSWDNIFKIMDDKGGVIGSSMRDYKDHIVRLIFIQQRRLKNRVFLRESVVDSAIEYIRNEHGIEGNDNIVPNILVSLNIISYVGYEGNQQKICEVLDSGHYQKHLNEKEFEILFEKIIQQTIHHGDVFGFIRDLQNFPTLRKEITSNKELLEIFKCLVRVYNLQVKIIQDDHKNMLTLLED